MVLYHSVNVHDADSLHIFPADPEAGWGEKCLGLLLSARIVPAGFSVSVIGLQAGPTNRRKNSHWIFHGLAATRTMAA